MEIKLTNTLGREKQVFKPVRPGEVGIYSCGLTVYYYAHIGNLRAYVFADTLKRMFLYNGYKIKHVMNITDVGHLESDQDEGEDKISKEAAKEGKTANQIAEYYTNCFFEDLKTMNILMPDVTPKATEHIQEMIEFNKRLEERGFTYFSEGNLYFDTTKFPEYGRLANLKLDEEAAKSRTGKDPAKKNYFDFALWLTNHKYKDHEMQWDSPWGKGFPGWHIECSAMSSKYLGEQFDIHTGGIDHVPVHHVNEIAQSEACFGHKWVNYWLHNEFVVIGDNEKMSKSKGNIIRITDLIKDGFDAMEYRYFLLQTHYRKRVAFTIENMKHAQNSFSKLKNKILSLEDKDDLDKQAFAQHTNSFMEHINDDLNLPGALAHMHTMLDSEISGTTKLALLEDYDKVLGLRLLEARSQHIPEQVLTLKHERDKARKDKDWAKSDELRGKLSELGYQVRDDKDQSTLVRK